MAARTRSSAVAHRLHLGRVEVALRGTPARSRRRAAARCGRAAARRGARRGGAPSRGSAASGRSRRSSGGGRRRRLRARGRAGSGGGAAPVAQQRPDGDLFADRRHRTTGRARTITSEGMDRPRPAGTLTPWTSSSMPRHPPPPDDVARPGWTGTPTAARSAARSTAGAAMTWPTASAVPPPSGPRSERRPLNRPLLQACGSRYLIDNKPSRTQAVLGEGAPMTTHPDTRPRPPSVPALIAEYEAFADRSSPCRRRIGTGRPAAKASRSATSRATWSGSPKTSRRRVPGSRTAEAEAASVRDDGPAGAAARLRIAIDAVRGAGLRSRRRGMGRSERAPRSHARSGRADPVVRHVRPRRRPARRGRAARAHAAPGSTRA